MGAHIITLLFPKRELAIGERSKPMFPTIKVPQVGVAIGGAAEASST
jgi:hypothetical protein